MIEEKEVSAQDDSRERSGGSFPSVSSLSSPLSPSPATRSPVQDIKVQASAPVAGSTAASAGQAALFKQLKRKRSLERDGTVSVSKKRKTKAFDAASLDTDPGFEADTEDTAANEGTFIFERTEVEERKTVSTAEEDVFFLFAPPVADKSIFSVILKTLPVTPAISGPDPKLINPIPAAYEQEPDEEGDEERDEESGEESDASRVRYSSPPESEYDSENPSLSDYEGRDVYNAAEIIRQFEGPEDSDDDGDRVEGIDHVGIARSDVNERVEAFEELLEKDIAQESFSRLSDIAQIFDEDSDLELDENLLERAFELAVKEDDEDAVRDLLRIGAYPDLLPAIEDGNETLVALLIEEFKPDVIDDVHVPAAIKADSYDILSHLETDVTKDNVVLAATTHKYESLGYFLDQNFSKAYEWALNTLRWPKPDLKIIKLICEHAQEDEEAYIDEGFLKPAIKFKNVEAIQLFLAAGVSPEEYFTIVIKMNSLEVLEAFKIAANDDNVKMAAHHHYFNALKYFFKINPGDTYQFVLEEVIERSDEDLLENLCSYLTEDKEIRDLVSALIKHKEKKLIFVLLKNLGVSRVLDVVKTAKKLHEKVSKFATLPWTEYVDSEADVQALTATFEDTLAISRILLPYPGKTVKGAVDKDIENLRNRISADPKLSDHIKKSASLIGVSLSVATRHFISTIKSPYYQFHRTKSETYPRSGLSDFAQHFKEQSKYKPHESRPEMKVESTKKQKLLMGFEASVGRYLPALEVLMSDASVPARDEVKSTPSFGDSVWYDSNLRYRQEICDYIITEFGKNGKGKAITPGFYNQYPCLMVYIKKPNEAPPDKNMGSSMDGWTQIVTSFFFGIVNYIAQNQGFAIELVRRSSFGALTPTIAPCGQSFRINVGMIPKDYAYVLAKALVILDKSLHSLYTERDAVADQISKDCFLSQPGYTSYLGREIPKETSLFRSMWLKVERTKQGKRMVQSIVRSVFARDGISAQVYQHIQMRYPKSPEDCATIFLHALSWAVNEKMKLNPVAGGPSASLSFGDSGTIEFKPIIKKHIKIEDKDFFKTISGLMECIQEKSKSVIDIPQLVIEQQNLHIKAIKNCVENCTVADLYFQLEYLNEILYSLSIFEATEVRSGDYGSDSDISDTDAQHVRIYARKVIVLNGMRAIWSGLHAAAEYLSGKRVTNKAGVYLSGAYYEVGEIIGVLQEHSFFSKKNKLKGSSILFHDLNSCIINGKPIAPILPEDLSTIQILILDSTSATVAECQKWVKIFKSCNNIKILLFVSSGFKNEQIGADKNQYGTVRIFSKDKALLETICQSLKEAERPVRAAVSHSYRRLMKRLGFAPTNAAILDKSIARSKEETKQNILYENIVAGAVTQNSLPYFAPSSQLTESVGSGSSSSPLFFSNFSNSSSASADVKQLSSSMSSWEKSQIEVAVAASLKDNKDIKEQTEKAIRAISAFGFNMVEVPGDGNCLYHAIHHQLKNRDKDGHLKPDEKARMPIDISPEKLRKKSLAYMLANSEKYGNLIQIDCIRDEGGSIRETFLPFGLKHLPDSAKGKALAEFKKNWSAYQLPKHEATPLTFNDLVSLPASRTCELIEKIFDTLSAQEKVESRAANMLEKRVNRDGSVLWEYADALEIDALARALNISIAIVNPDALNNLTHIALGHKVRIAYIVRVNRNHYNALIGYPDSEKSRSQWRALNKACDEQNLIVGSGLSEQEILRVAALESVDDMKKIFTSHAASLAVRSSSSSSSISISSRSSSSSSSNTSIVSSSLLSSSLSSSVKPKPTRQKESHEATAEFSAVKEGSPVIPNK